MLLLCGVYVIFASNMCKRKRKVGGKISCVYRAINDTKNGTIFALIPYETP